jgi:hypothetical protein
VSPGTSRFHILDAPDGRRSAAALLRGLEMWVFKAEGREAATLLRRIIASATIASLED